MIEKTILDYINANAGFPAYMEIPAGGAEPPFAVIEKTGGGEANHVKAATLAIQSFGATLYEAAQTNEAVKAIMAAAAELPEIGAVRLNSDYNYTDTASKRYRYQAVFEIIHY